MLRAVYRDSRVSDIRRFFIVHDKPEQRSRVPVS